MASTGMRLGMRLNASALCAPRSIPSQARFLSTAPVRLMGARYPLGSTVARQAAPRMSMLWGSSRAMSAAATSAPTTAASAPATVLEPALATPTAVATPTESITAASTTGSYSDLVPAATEPATSLVDPELVSNIIAPLQYGDLAALGLTGWNPAALVRSLIEAIQVTTSMPWAPTIITTVVLVRLAVLPLHIRAMRNTARLQKYMPRLEVLKEEMNAARITGDRLALQRAALAQRAVYQEAGVKVSAMMLGPVSTLVSQLGLFFGIKTLCEFPLKQLTIGGPSWCPDLSAADPTYILPMINMIAIQASLWSASKDVTNAQGGHMINFMRLVSLPGVWFFLQWPAGLNIGLTAGTTFMIAQGVLLRNNAVRKMLDIPLIPKEAVPKLPTMMDTLRNIPVYFRNRIKEAEAKQLRQNAARR